MFQPCLMGPREGCWRHRGRGWCRQSEQDGVAGHRRQVSSWGWADCLHLQTIPVSTGSPISPLSWRTEWRVTPLRATPSTSLHPPNSIYHPPGPWADLHHPPWSGATHRRVAPSPLPGFAPCSSFPRRFQTRSAPWVFSWAQPLLLGAFITDDQVLCHHLSRIQFLGKEGATGACFTQCLALGCPSLESEWTGEGR